MSMSRNYLELFRALVVYNRFDYSQAEIARRLDISPATLSRHVTGEVFPSLVTAIALAVELQCSDGQMQEIRRLYFEVKHNKHVAITEHHAAVRAQLQGPDTDKFTPDQRKVALERMRIVREER